MVHLRIVAPPDRSDQVHSLLCDTASAIDVIRVPARRRGRTAT